jgi:hypothetical protein
MIFIISLYVHIDYIVMYGRNLQFMSLIKRSDKVMISSEVTVVLKC